MSSGITTDKDNLLFERRTAYKGSMIIREGDTGDCAFLIQSGRVKVFTFDEQHREVQFAVLEAGEIFGEMSLLFDAPRAASVQALDDTVLIVITRETFRYKLQRSDPTVRAVVEMLARRILDTNRTFLDKKDALGDLRDTCTEIYSSIMTSLPRTQQRTFQNTVLPRLEEFLQVVRDFEERFADD
jgi:CRP-like cAMP-binding protein